MCEGRERRLPHIECVHIRREVGIGIVIGRIPPATIPEEEYDDGGNDDGYNSAAHSDADYGRSLNGGGCGWRSSERGAARCRASSGAHGGSAGPDRVLGRSDDLGDGRAFCDGHDRSHIDGCLGIEDAAGM